MGTFLPLLSYIIPVIGKLLLTIPFIPNKAIPFVLGAFNVASKYWLLLGFPTATAYLGGGNHFAILGIGSVVPVVWGCLEQFLWHNWYERQKARAALNGTTSWWSKHSADLWKKA